VTLASFDTEIRRRWGWPVLIGVDEAGRGPLAGPVLASAVLLDGPASEGLEEVRDSKLLSPRQREKIFGLIRLKALAFSVSWATPREIERQNILQATLCAMRRATLRASRSRQAPVLVDGNHPIPGLDLPQEALIGGDRLSLVVACASILAKVLRDRWMKRLDHLYPGYGFSRHKGYGTAEHLRALEVFGPCRLHRRTYSPVFSIKRNLLFRKRRPAADLPNVLLNFG
jgi:ribonuclease HII